MTTRWEFFLHQLGFFYVFMSNDFENIFFAFFNFFFLQIDSFSAFETDVKQNISSVNSMPVTASSLKKVFCDNDVSSIKHLKHNRRGKNSTKKLYEKEKILSQSNRNRICSHVAEFRVDTKKPPLLSDYRKILATFPTESQVRITSNII